MISCEIVYDSYMKNTTKTIIINIAIALLSVAVFGVVGRLLTDTNSAWFTALNKPTEFVPSLVFTIMWSLIYLCFAAVIFLLLQRKQITPSTLALLLLTGVFQWLWSLVYFRLHSLLLGLVMLVVLGALAILLFANLLKKDKLYLYILGIYPMWLTLAAFINLSLWAIN